MTDLHRPGAASIRTMTLFGGLSRDIEYVARGLTYGARIKYQFD